MSSCEPESKYTGLARALLLEVIERPQGSEDRVGVIAAAMERAEKAGTAAVTAYGEAREASYGFRVEELRKQLSRAEDRVRDLEYILRAVKAPIPPVTPEASQG